MCLCDMGAHVRCGAEVVDHAFGIPFRHLLSRNGGAVFGPGRAKDLEPDPRPLPFQQPRGLDIFMHALVAQQAGDHQEAGLLATWIGRGVEILQIDAGAGQHLGLVRAHETAG